MPLTGMDAWDAIVKLLNDVLGKQGVETEDAMRA
jgi:hypothetical protein